MKLISPLPQTLPEKFSDAARYGVMISNAWPNSRSTRGATLEVINRVFQQFPFFAVVQTVDIPFADERRAVREIVRGTGRPHTYMLTRVLNENNLNLSSPDASTRDLACKKIISCFDDALEVGATVIGLVSGPRPAAEHARADALRGLEESLAKICAAAKPIGLQIEIEPLDYDAHKRATLGTTQEAVAICQNLARLGLDLRLCIDQAHALLNNEDVFAAITLAQPHMHEFHICNAVLDRAHPLFGDRHLPLGAPGVVDCDALANLLGRLIAAGFFDSAKTPRPIISCEVLTPENHDPLALIGKYSQTLQDAWAQARTRARQG